MEFFSYFEQRLRNCSFCNRSNDFQYNLFLIINSIEFIDATLFNFTEKSKSTTKKNSDKQQQTQTIKNLILETLQDTTSIITTELVHHKQKTIDTLILITEKMTTYPSNVPAQLRPLEEREEPEEQHQQWTSTWIKSNIGSISIKPKNNNSLVVRNYPSSIISKYNINNKSCKSYNKETLAIISHNHFRINMLMLVLFLMKNKTL